MSRSRAPLVLAAVSCLASIASTAAPPRPTLIWNASASAPVGLYAVRGLRRPAVTDLVVVRPPKLLAGWLASRRYLPVGVPLLKHIAALHGQRVCRSGDLVSVDGVAAARALDRDHHGRSLPVWSGCVVLGADQVFLLNPERRDSLDSRYFGPLPSIAVVGWAHPIWTRRGVP